MPELDARSTRRCRRPSHRSSAGGMALRLALVAALPGTLAMPLHAGRASSRKAEGPAVARLADGTALVVHPMPGAARAAVRVVVGSGGDDDPSHLAGLAHLVAVAVLQGTYHAKDGALFRQLAALGGTLAVNVGPDVTVFALDAPRAGLAPALAPLLETLTAPALPFVDLDREQRALSAAADDEAPLTGFAWAARHVAFPSGHGGLTLLGTSETRRAVTRDDLMQFFEDHYLPHNTVVVVVGDVTLEDVRANVEAGLRGAPVPPVARAADPRDANVPSEARGKGRRTLAVQAVLVDGQPAAACTAAAAVLELRLRRRLSSGSGLPAEAIAGCDHAWGHQLLVVAARSASPDSSSLPEIVAGVRRAAAAAPPTTAEQAAVSARVAALHQTALATPAGVAALLVLAAAPNEAPLDERMARALAPPRLDLAGAKRVLAAGADDGRLVDVAFSRFAQ